MTRKRLVAASVIALASALVSSTGALATLTLTIGTAPTFSLTLDGSDQSASYTLPLTVANGGSTKFGGWNLTITSTTFTNVGGKTLPTTASTVTGAAIGACAGSVCPTNSVTYPVAVPAGGTAPGAVKFFNAALNTGTGTVDVTPTIAVTVPGNSFTGTYTSTLTVAVVAGP